MNTESLLYFKVLAECEHYAQASKMLNIAPSTLSYAIRKMEEELGVPLFIRSGRNVSLSPYGEAFYRGACRILCEFENSKAELESLRKKHQPEITVGFVRQVAPYSFFPQLVYGFMNRKDGLDLSVNTVPYVASKQLLSDIRAKKIDFGICMKTESLAGLAATKVLRRHIYALVPGNHPLAGRDTVSLHELVNNTLILEGEAPTNRAFVDYCKRLTPNPSAVITSGRFHMMTLAASGEGIGVTSDTSSAEVFDLKAMVISDMPLDELQLDIDFHLVYGPVLPSERQKLQFIDYVKRNPVFDTAEIQKD